MSDVAIGRQKAANPFQVGAIILMLALGIVGFIGVLILGAYAPDFKSGRNGGGHALSNSATGFSAIVELARATGRKPCIVRNEHEFGTENLLIATPENGAVNMGPLLDVRGTKPTLIVLPKWQTTGSTRHSGWVNWVGLVPLFTPQAVLAPDYRFIMAQHRSGGAALVMQGLPASIQMRAPRPLQVITGFAKPRAPDATGTDAAPLEKDGFDDDSPNESDDAPQKPVQHMITPLITDGKGGIVLGQIDGRPLFVLADPDILSNVGMRDVRQAAAALALLDWLNSNPPDGIAFDVSLNGFGHSRSPLKLLFEPPFLAMTICIAVALLLAGWQAVGRFGAAQERQRAIAFGKAALVDNSAALIRKAGRERAMGKRYAAVIRERAVVVFAIPARLRDKALDAYLDKLPGNSRFTDLLARAEAADDRATMLAAAQALHNWQKEKTG